MARKLLIIVPAYNESGRITETVRALNVQLKGMSDIEGKVIVIDDGSSDDTAAIAVGAGADMVISHKTNRGLGAAIRTGLGVAKRERADIAVKFDADLQHDPADLPALIAPIVENAADIVYGNRFNRIDYKMPIVRSVGNKVFLRLMRWLTKWPLKDSQPGLFAINHDYLEVFNLPGDYNYTQQILLDAYLKGMRFEHVDVAFTKRTTGKSFISFKYPFKVLPQILMVLVAVRPLKVFTPVAFFFLFIAISVFATELAEWLVDDSVGKPVRSVNLVMGMGLFGLQTLFFGFLAELIVMTRRN